MFSIQLGSAMQHVKVCDGNFLFCFLIQFQLNDSHYMAYVHWAGDHRDTIVVLTRDRNPGLQSNSHVWISRDYGHSFVNRTSSFRTPSNAYALIDMFYPSPVDKTRVREGFGSALCAYWRSEL